VVWAHNSHIGNAAATAMGWQGEFNIGELCRAAFGDSAALIGFGTDRGTVAAASDWDGPMEVKTVLPARPVFRQSSVERSLTDWRGAGKRELRDVLAKPRLERAIGVIYRPETEFSSHYFQAVLSDQFDAYVWFEQTRAVTPPARRARHLSVRLIDRRPLLSSREPSPLTSDLKPYPRRNRTRVWKCPTSLKRRPERGAW
jgi:erythromycin esterase-like protein